MMLHAIAKHPFPRLHPTAQSECRNLPRAGHRLWTPKEALSLYIFHEQLPLQHIHRRHTDLTNSRDQAPKVSGNSVIYPNWVQPPHYGPVP
ncbi:hypothetical protein K523DRAFT_66937 [Schizophyllum commune Tattone D]|nr:hypothetical protein K523DRAFT_66937 [Schizophyllum commune Tattone D]